MPLYSTVLQESMPWATSYTQARGVLNDDAENVALCIRENLVRAVLSPQVCLFTSLADPLNEPESLAVVRTML